MGIWNVANPYSTVHHYEKIITKTDSVTRTAVQGNPLVVGPVVFGNDSGTYVGYTYTNTLQSNVSVNTALMTVTGPALVNTLQANTSVNTNVLTVVSNTYTSTLQSNVDKKGIRTITELKLYEGSAVLWAANPETPTLDVKSEVKREELVDRLEKLSKAFKGGRFTDDTFSLMEIEIKKIQSTCQLPLATNRPDRI